MTIDRRTGEITLAVLWVILGAGLIGLTFDMREGAPNDPLGPAFLPRIIGGLLMALGAWLAWRAVRRWASHEAAGSVEPDEASADGLIEDRPLRGIAAIGIVIGYLLLMPLVGYLPSTVGASAALLWVQGARGVLLVALPVGLAVVLFAIFSTVLSVRFP